MSVQEVSMFIAAIGGIGVLLLLAMIVAVLVKRPGAPAAVPRLLGGLALIVLSRFAFIPFAALSADPDVGVLVGSAVTMVLGTAGVAMLVLAVYRAAGSAGPEPGLHRNGMGFVADRSDEEVLAQSPLRATPPSAPPWDPPRNPPQNPSAGYERQHD